MKCADHKAVRLFELRRVDELPFLFCQRQQLDLAIDAFSHRSFSDEIDPVLAGATGGHLSKVPDVRDTDLVDRGHTVVEPDLVNEPRNGRLIKIQVLGDLLLSRHEYDPLWRLASREKARVCCPAC
ncbi:hypothetical protein WJ32_10205 [Burkholderia ubonensis]|uniref:Uncharacterized protein n=1 Tax=Burkholderia ubonensis TaxID=101571 RepID=A0A103RHT5_9BURK|nr:hypothetical protein WJ32_10205 [Burkholderia ubonensis]KVG67947.1 hypothetical protein WJ33_24130 [Burkholderia ubonensis]